MPSDFLIQCMYRHDQAPYANPRYIHSQFPELETSSCQAERDVVEDRYLVHSRSAKGIRLDCFLAVHVALPNEDTQSNEGALQKYPREMLASTTGQVEREENEDAPIIGK